jgi:ubiquinone/menaquinone biosynthesis C-methylase UbiE
LSAFNAPEIDQRKAVNNAFTKQSINFDHEDKSNPVLQHMRTQVYDHVKKFLRPQSKILELNAGTGIDALTFATWGHDVLATDLSDGMILQIQKKITENKVYNLHVQQISFDQIGMLEDTGFDFVFSNFGGLNCLRDLSAVTTQLPKLLNPGAFVTWVIMPRVYLWEIASLLKGNTKNAFRRFAEQGVVAHLEKEYFMTYYHSLASIKSAFPTTFKFIETEGLAALTPPPHRGDFPGKHPKLYKFLSRLDKISRNNFPFNRCADHIIVTFQYNP